MNLVFQSKVSHSNKFITQHSITNTDGNQHLHDFKCKGLLYLALGAA